MRWHQKINRSLGIISRSRLPPFHICEIVKKGSIISFWRVNLDIKGAVRCVLCLGKTPWQPLVNNISGLFRDLNLNYIYQVTYDHLNSVYQEWEWHINSTLCLTLSVPISCKVRCLLLKRLTYMYLALAWQRYLCLTRSRWVLLAPGCLYSVLPSLFTIDKHNLLHLFLCAMVRLSDYTADYKWVFFLKAGGSWKVYWIQLKHTSSPYITLVNRQNRRCTISIFHLLNLFFFFFFKNISTCSHLPIQKTWHSLSGARYISIYMAYMYSERV